MADARQQQKVAHSMRLARDRFEWRMFAEWMNCLLQRIRMPILQIE